MPISSVETTLQLLMEAIIAGEFDSGVPPQDVLALRYKVSRTVLREAVSKLEASNIVLSRPKIGTKVRPRSDWQLLNYVVAKNYLKNNQSKKLLLDTLTFFCTTGYHVATIVRSRLDCKLIRFPTFEMDVDGIARMHAWIFENSDIGIYAQMATVVHEFVLATAEVADLANERSTVVYYHRSIHALLAGDPVAKNQGTLFNIYNNLKEAMSDRLVAAKMQSMADAL
jgi:DNA-binding transcriptional regulator YhcF (GntR family)